MTTLADQFQIDCALMAGAVYVSNRDPINQLPVPPGWSLKKYVTGPSGFEAASFYDGSQIVISYAGTEPLSWDDWVTNGALASGQGATQLDQAADFYLKTVAANPGVPISFTGHSLGGGLASLMAVFFNEQAVTFDQAPFAKSASIAVANELMSYLSDPARSYNTSALMSAETLLLQDLNDFVSSASSGTTPNTSNVTDFNVSGEFLSLAPFSSLDRIGSQKDIQIGANTVSRFGLHSEGLLEAFLLSDQASPQQSLNGVTSSLTDLLGMMFNSQLFSYSTGKKNTKNPNFIELIVQHQEGVSNSTLNQVPETAITADNMVTRFTADLWAIAQPGGLTMSNKNLTDALIAFAMQKYYSETTTSAGYQKDFFNTNGIANGIEFSMSDVAPTLGQAKGYTQYFLNYLLASLNPDALHLPGTDLSYLRPDELGAINTLLPSLRDWYIQAGQSGMVATDALLNQGAFMLGGTGNNGLVGGAGNDLLVAGASGVDTLDGGAGNDVLMAGKGDDVLIAGQGNDTLYGGGGNDTFNFVSSGSGGATETIKYDNGKGSVEVNGTQLVDVITLLASSSTGSTWQDSNGDQYQFVAAPNTLLGFLNGTNGNTGTLTITQGLLGSGNQIVIDNFDMKAAQSSAGYLGMKFREHLALQANTSASSPFSSGIPSDQTATMGHGNTQTFTVYASSVSNTDQTIQLVSSGAGSYALSLGSTQIPLSGPVNLVIPAGQSSATFTLVDLSNTSTPDTAQLTASMTDANGNVINSNNLAITFNAPSAGTTTPSAGTADRTIIGDLQPVNFGTSSSPQYHYDDLGNIVVDPNTASPGRDDTLYGSTGNDLINTGDGNNYVGAAQGGNDTINGGSGDDTLLAGDGSNTINSGDGNDTIQAGNGDNTITGGAGNDNVTAGNGKNVIIGNGGQDVLIAGGGNNQIYANQQIDVATALAQAQSASPSGSKGTLLAVGDGNNTIVGGTGNDAIFTGTGNNTIVCGPGSVSLVGGVEVASAVTGWNVTVTNGSVYAFNGVSYGSAPFNAPPDYKGSTANGVPVGLGNDTIFGGKGDSTYWLSNGNNWLDAGGGNDYIQAGIGNNTIFGGAGSDTIFGGGGNNFINLESGNDYVVAQGGNSTIIGGTGNDTIASGDMGPGWATSQTAANNYIYGGAGNSVIFGSGGNDTLIGGTGNTTIYGGDGNEYIVGGDGNVSINGGNGNDTIYAGGNGNDTIFAGDGNTTIYGGGGSDTIVGGAGTDIISAGDGGTTDAPTQLYAGSGTSSLYGGAGTDQLFGGSGSDTLVAGTGDSTLQGGSGTEVMYASIGTATLIAGSGNDTLYGGDGNATLQGGSGTALMVAGGGANTLIGGSGQNTYEVDPGFGNITIQPGSPGDTLLFGSGIALADISVTADVTDAGQSVLVIDVATGGSISIVGGLTDSLDQFNVGGATYTLQQLLQVASTNPSDSAGATGDLIFSAYAGDTLGGTGGNDTIAAYGVNATLAGGGGDTTFIVTDASQVVSETNGNVNDTIQSSVSYVLPTNVQNLTLYGQADLVATGNDLANVLSANNGNDTLIAGAGVATMVGGTGYDTFVVNNAADVVQAQANAANNTVRSSVSYVVPENVQTLILTGNSDLIGTGNDQANTIQANNGNDTLIAGLGIVTLVGGTGNDTFVINNAADVVQAQAGGTNTIQTSVSYVAPDNVQSLIGTGTADLALTGNSQTNMVVTANAGNDTLRGGTGSGTLVGGSGQDTFALTGVGNYTAEKAASTNATVQLDPGLDFTDVSAVQLGNDLLLQVGTSSLRLQNYYLDPQAWTIKDALGNTTTAQTLLDATAQESANKLSQLEHQFFSQVKAGYIQNLMSQGYSQQANGSWSTVPSMNAVSAQYMIQNGYVATQTWDTATGIVNYSTPVPQQSTSWSSSHLYYSEQTATIQQITTNAVDQVIYANAASSSWTHNAVWFKVNWNYSLGLPTSTSTYGSLPVASTGPVSGVSFPYGTSYYTYNGVISWQVQWGTDTFYSVNGTLDGGFPGAMLSSPGYLTTQGPFPQAIAGDFYQFQTTDVIQQINVGSGDHTVYASNLTLVNSGDGNNTIYNAGFVDAGTGNDSIYYAGTVYSESGNDYIEGASTVYGGSGNDTIIGATTVVTGTGNDTIFGSGPGTITINPGINGMDLIGNEGNLDAEFLDAYFQAQGASDGAERYQYAGLYKILNSNYAYSAVAYSSESSSINPNGSFLAPHASSMMIAYGGYQYLNAQDALLYLQNSQSYDGEVVPTTLQQAITDGWMSYIDPLSSIFDLADGQIQPSAYYDTSGTLVTATIAANNFTALAPFFDSGALPAETVNFGAGISLANLQFSWGAVTTNEGGLAVPGPYTTLNISWGLNQGIEVIMPHQYDPIGSGVQEFVFADGTKKSMADMIALAPPAPTFDPEIFNFQQGMGQQVLPADAQHVVFAAGITISNLRLSLNGTDLVLSDQGGADSLVIPNGAADPGVIYNLAFAFSDGSTLSYYADGQGNDTFYQYDRQGYGIGDLWVKNDGSSGWDRTNADGSSISYTNDGQGDTITQQFDTQGNYIGDQWVRANGSQGTDSFNTLTNQATGSVTPANGASLSWSTTPSGNGNVLETWNTGDTLVGGTGDDTLFGFGNNDTLTAGMGGNYLYGSGNGDVLVSGAGNDTLVGTGNNDTFIINAGSGVDTIIATGSNDTINAASTGNTFDLLGSGGTLDSGTFAETVYATGDSETISVGAGSMVTLSGTNSDATVGSNSTVTVSGTDNSVTAGNGSTITLNANTHTGLSLNHGTVDYTGSNMWSTMSGSNDILNLASGATGDMALLFGNNNTINVASAGNSFTLLGSGDTLNSGTAAETVWDYANSTSVSVGDGSTVTLYASNSTTTVGSNSTVSLGGSNNSVTAGIGSTITLNTGTGNGLTLTDSTINVMGSNTTYAIYGSGNTVNTVSGATGNLALVMGDNNILDPVGAGNIFDLLGAGETLNSGMAPETVYSTGGYESITVGSGSTVTLMDFNDNVTVGSNSTVTLNDFNDSVTVGSNSSVTVDGDGDSITAGSGSIITLASGIGNALTLTDGMLNVTGSDVWSTIIGSNDTISLASGVTGNTMDVFGSNNIINVMSAGNSIALMTGSSNDTINVASAGNSFTLLGSGDILNSGTASETVYAMGDSETIAVGDGSTVTLSGTNSDATVGGNSTVSVIGDKNSVTAGNGSTITLSTGTNTGLSINHGTVDYNGSSIWTTLAGGNNTINVASGVTGDMAIVFGNNNTFNVASAGNRFTLLGSGDVLNSGTAAETVWDYASNSSVTVGDGSTVTVATNTSDATVGSNSTVTLSGNSNSVTAGSGSTITLLAGLGNALTLTNDTLNVTGTNASYAIYGSGNTVNTASGATGNLALVIGDGNTLDPIGAGNTFNLMGSGETLTSMAAETVYSTGDSETISVGAGSAVTLSGTNSDATVGGNSMVTVFGGNDTVTAGSGSTITINNASDVIQFSAAGANTLQTSVSYVAPTNVQSLIGTGAGDITLTGNTLNDFILGNAGNDILVGGAGTDVLQAGTGNTLLADSSGVGALIGVGGNDTLVGGSQNDFLAGGGGAIPTLPAPVRTSSASTKVMGLTWLMPQQVRPTPCLWVAGLTTLTCRSPRAVTT